MKLTIGILFFFMSFYVSAQKATAPMPSGGGLTAPTDTTIAPRDYNGTGSLSNSVPSSVSELEQQREEAEEKHQPKEPGGKKVEWDK